MHIRKYKSRNDTCLSICKWIKWFRHLYGWNVIATIINQNLEQFRDKSADEIFIDRKNKFLKIGRSKGFMSDLENLSSLKSKNNNFELIIKYKKFLFLVAGIVIFLTTLLIVLL